MDDPHLRPFALLILAWVAWILLVVLLLPRLLGRLLSFLANRASRNAFHVSVPVLHIYPLAGRVVAHSLVYTLPDATVSVEELVLQARWWRKPPAIGLQNFLALNDLHQLDPVAHAQQQTAREKNANFLKRLFYKLRTAWHRSSHTPDPTVAKELAPLISLVCVGVRARIVNNSAHFKHVQTVLDMANDARPQGGPRTPQSSTDFDVPVDDLSADDPAHVRQGPDASSHRHMSVSSSDAAVEPVAAKPFRHRLLELVSLRITTGAFYICDMAQSPLVRVVVDFAKVRYCYGAPACPIDISRKRIRLRLSGLKISIADRRAVQAIAHPHEEPLSMSQQGVPDNTDRMLRRVLHDGYRALNQSVRSPTCKSPKKRPRSVGVSSGSGSTLQRGQESQEGRQPFHLRSRAETREAGKQKDLTCSDVLSCKTAVAYYVFDEPGFIRPRASHARGHHTSTNTFEAATEDSGFTTAPICRLSIVLRGASFSYDMKAMADMERLSERLQPSLYHLAALSTKLRSGDGKRQATGIQVEIDATPADMAPSDAKQAKPTTAAEQPPVVAIRFDPQPATWKGLTTMNVREWDDNLSDRLRSSKESSQQKIVVVGTHCTARTVGVVDMPICKSRQVTITRTLQHPLVWNDIQTSAVEMAMKDLDYTFVPDTHRIFEDLSSTMAEKRRKPLDIRYFIPFKETVRIRAEGSYTVVMACSHDNAWEDIKSRQGDNLGRIKIRGECGEMLLSPSVPTEYIPTASVFSWNLSLPECFGEIEMPLHDEPGQADETEDGHRVYRASDSYRSPQYKGRAPSLAQRVRSQLSTVLPREPSISLKKPRDFITVKVLQTGKVCLITGKVLVNEHHSVLQPETPAFLDSVNTTDINLKASSLTMDINPHHISHFLSLVRNYVGTGNHTLSVGERTKLHLQRKSISRAAVDGFRYPSTDECMILGLSNAISPKSLIHSMDDLLSLRFDAESLVVRLHLLPHALCQFHSASGQTFSIVSGEFGGLLRSNRLGAHLELAPKHRQPLVLQSVYGGETMESSRDSRHTFQGQASPKIIIESFKVRKRVRSCPKSGAYYAVLEVQSGTVHGCIMDEDLFSLSRIAMALLPEPVYEDQVAIAAMLAVYNIDIIIEKIDILILSVASAAFSESSGRSGQSSVIQRARGSNNQYKNRYVPNVLAGVTELQASAGLRFCSSSMATEEFASRSRLHIPYLSLNVLTSFSGKLTTWVDEATLKAQVAHAILAGKGNHQGSYHDIGLMRSVAEIVETSLEVVSESRPNIWDTRVSSLQAQRVAKKSEASGCDVSPWFLDLSSLPMASFGTLTGRQELELAWWIYLKRSRKARSLGHESYGASQQGRLDSFSAIISSELTVVVSPDCLELANDVSRRCKERALGSEYATSVNQNYETAKGVPPGVSVSADINSLWDVYERSRPPSWLTPTQTTTAFLHRGLEVQSPKIFFMSTLPGEVRTNEQSFRPESVYGGIHACFPLGFHYTFIGETIVSPIRSAATEGQEASPDYRSVHKEDFHVAIPSFMIGRAKEYMCNVSRVMMSLRVKSIVRRAVEEASDSSEGLICDEKRSLTGSVSSIAVGKEESRLGLYASIGGAVSIFVLLSRALALECNSYFQVESRKQDAVCQVIFQCPSCDLQEKKAPQIRGVLARLSQIARDQNESLKERVVAFTSTRPDVTADDNTLVPGRVVRQVVASAHMMLHNLSLQVACEHILSVDIITCKWGSTVQGRKSGFLEGHTVIGSFGTISVSIRDDLAADTLRMVSEVASYVRRATYSIPMLRYGDHAANSQQSASGMERGQAFNSANNNFPRTASMPLGNVGAYRHNTWRSPGSQPSPRLHRQLLTRRYSIPRTGIGSTPSSLRGSAGVSEPNLRSEAVRHSDVPHSTGQKPRHISKGTDIHQGNTGTIGRSKDQSSDVRQDPVQDGRVHRNDSAARRRSRPMSSADADHNGFLSQRFTQERDTFKEDNQFYSYVAIPTAGETGPPRKRAKCRVRVSPMIPPSFYDFERLSPEESISPKEDMSTRRDMVTGSKSADRRVYEHLVPERHEERKKIYPDHVQVTLTPATTGSFPAATRSTPSKNAPPLTVILSCQEVLARYFRRESPNTTNVRDNKVIAEINSSVSEVRLTWMSSPSKGSYSLVVTTSSAKLSSATDPNCILNGSVSKIGVTVSVFQSLASSVLPKLIASARVSEFKTTLRAKDLTSVKKFREEFKADLAAIASAFITTKSSIIEMTRATRLSSKSPYNGRSFASTIAFDLLLEHSQVSLEGFHPKDSAMRISYSLDGLFFSVVASEDDSAALTLGLRLYGHRIASFSPSWPSDEVFRFPSLDARGVQWGETLKLPTFLKVSAEPQVNFTSIQGLRHVLFTVAGLTAFQNTASVNHEMSEQYLGKSISAAAPDAVDFETKGQAESSGPTPFSRSFTAWERTKGVRMDLSLPPMSISLASGQVVALFELEAISGIFEWNKLVVSGVQLHATVGLPKITFMLMRMPTAEFTSTDVTLDEHRASLSVALERSRIDILKSQEGLTHTFIFRIDVLDISGQVRPWRLLMDAAVWADEEEFVSELQSINYTASSSGAHRTSKAPRLPESTAPREHRSFLLGFNIQRFKLAIPLNNNEKIASARLALRVTELHLLGRRRFDNSWSPVKNIVELKTHFIGVLWDNSALLSTHHSKITLALQRPSLNSDAHFGAVHVVMVAGTWRVCPRKDVIMAILGAKNRRVYRNRAANLRDRISALASTPRESSVDSGFSSTGTENESGLLFESLRLTILRTSGFIEGLETDDLPFEMSKDDQPGSAQYPRDATTSKLSVPAFSIAMIREESHDFDVVDIDFSGRKGEFPQGCLQKVSNLFSELFGAVALDQQMYQTAATQVQHSREMSRDVSVLIRFGKSLYRAQEEANTGVESKFCFFAGISSTILVSLSAKQIFGDEDGHTTVMSGISPKLALEVSPLIEGAQVQRVRFVDVRFLHGINPLHPPHTMLHVGKVTALLDTKTLLLAQGRVRSRKRLRHFPTLETNSEPSSLIGERKVATVLGQPRRRADPSKPCSETGEESTQQEPDIRLQVKLPTKSESPTNQVDLFAERLHFGIDRSRRNRNVESLPVNINVALHEVNIRGQWDILSCRIRLRENLFSCGTSGLAPRAGGSIEITNIMNRLQFESMQYGNYTMKLAVDALAAIGSFPRSEILVESTDVSTEISHTMIKAIMRLSGQMKKLRSEVSLVTEREQSKDTNKNQASKIYSYDRPSMDSMPSNDVQKRGAKNEAPEQPFLPAITPSDNQHRPANLELLRVISERTKVMVKGDLLRATLRGYQFEETQHSALFELERYDLSYERDFNSTSEPFHLKLLGIDFSNLTLAYNDDVRGIHSDLFKIPAPRLRMKVVDSNARLIVELTGELELRLGHGFYYWQDFKELSDLTVHGIRPTPEAEVGASSSEGQPELWNGKIPHVSVKLNPRIDVIGDLTNDMLPFMERRRIGIEMIPKHMFHYIIAPIDRLSDTLSRTLLK